MAVVVLLGIGLALLVIKARVRKTAFHYPELRNINAASAVLSWLVWVLVFWGCVFLTLRSVTAPSLNANAMKPTRILSTSFPVQE